MYKQITYSSMMHAEKEINRGKVVENDWGDEGQIEGLPCEL